MSDEPIEGVTLETFTKAAVAMHGAPPETWDAIAERFGIPAGRYQAIGEAWTARMGTDMALVNRYNELYQAAMVEAGITAPEITMEQYVDLIKTGGPTPENLARYGLDMQQFSMVSHRWTQAMGADVGLAQKFAQLFQQT